MRFTILTKHLCKCVFTNTFLYKKALNLLNKKKKEYFGVLKLEAEKHLFVVG